MNTKHAICSRNEQGLIRVHYSHLSEAQAQAEVDRLNDHLLAMGRIAVYWQEAHHPDQQFVIA